MKILSVVILLLNALYPDWIANKFFSSAVDQPNSTSITFSQQFSWEVRATTDSMIFAVTNFQILNISGKWTSDKKPMGHVNKIDSKEAVVSKDLMDNVSPKRSCVFYIIGTDEHWDLYSCYKLNEHRGWKVWRDFKYRVDVEGKVPEINSCNYLKDESEEYYKYYRSYLANTGDKFSCGRNFYSNDEVGNLITDFASRREGKLDKHNLSREENYNYIYTTCIKDRQINVINETLLINENSLRKFNYSLNTGQVKFEDDPVIYILKFNESIKDPQVTSNITNNDGSIPLIDLSSPYKTPKETHSTQSWCYSKYRTRNNSKCMHAYLTECFYKSKKPNQIKLQG